MSETPIYDKFHTAYNYKIIPNTKCDVDCSFDTESLNFTVNIPEVPVGVKRRRFRFTSLKRKNSSLFRSGGSTKSILKNKVNTNFRFEQANLCKDDNVSVGEFLQQMENNERRYSEYDLAHLRSQQLNHYYRG